MKPTKIRIPGYLGVNLLDNLTLLRPEELRNAKNLAYSSGSGLGKRLGIGHQRKVFPDEVVSFVSTFMPPFECDPFVFAVYKDVSNDVVAAIADAAVSSSTITNEYEGRPLFVAFDQSVFCFPGFPNVHAAVKLSKNVLSANGIDVVDFDFDGLDNGFAPRVAAAYRDRMAYFNLGPDYENNGVFSDDLEPEVIGNQARDTRGFLFGGLDGDRITGAIEVNLSDSGTPASSALLIFREFSTYLLKGEPAQTTDVSDYFGDVEISKLNVACGCSSAQTIVSTPYGVIWAGHDDVWLLKSGQLPVAVGTRLRKRLLETPPAFRYLWSAIYKDGVYRLSICSPGQGPAANSDACGEQWWLDLRDGAPQNFRQARWFGPHVYLVQAVNGHSVAAGSHMQIVDTRPGRYNDIYSVEGENLAVYDNVEGYDRVQNTTPGIVVMPGQMVRLTNVITVSLPVAHGLSVGNSIILDEATLISIESEFAAGTYTVASVPTTESFTFASVAANFTNLCTHSFRRSNTLYVSDQFDNEVTTDLHSKAYDLENALVDKTLCAAKLNVQVSMPTRVDATVLTDRGRLVNVLTDNITAPGLEADVDEADDDLLTEEFVAAGLFPTPSLRANGKTQQLKLADVPGYVITDAMTTWTFYSPNGNGLLTATLTPGYYSTLQTFLDHIIDAMNTVDGIVWEHNEQPESEFSIPPRYPLATIGTELGGFAFLFLDDGSVVADQSLTAAQLLSNRLIGAALGFNTNADQLAEGPGDVVGFQISATAPVPWKRSPTLEYGSIVLELKSQRRDPV